MRIRCQYGEAEQTARIAVTLVNERKLDTKYSRTCVTFLLPV